MTALFWFMFHFDSFWHVIFQSVFFLTIIALIADSGKLSARRPMPSWLDGSLAHFDESHVQQGIRFWSKLRISHLSLQHLSTWTHFDRLHPDQTGFFKQMVHMMMQRTWISYCFLLLPNNTLVIIPYESVSSFTFVAARHQMTKMILNALSSGRTALKWSKCSSWKKWLQIHSLWNCCLFVTCCW